MMRCGEFVYRAPATLAEAAAILAAEGPSAVLLGGGTDVIPGMKRRTQAPRTLVSLRRIAELQKLEAAPSGGVSIGASITLSAIAAAPLLRPYAALQRAASVVATPHIRNAGTIGGNLCVDTRCNYYDQNFEWRKAIDFCMKTEAPGKSICWVAPGSPRCWAVSSTDLAPALIALGAEVVLVSAGGVRVIPLAALYADDGIAYLSKRPDEVIARVQLSLAPSAAAGGAGGWRSTYWKLRRREAFDFPVLSLAAAVHLDAGGTVTAAHLVFGAVASRPVSAEAATRLVGQRLTDDAIEAVAEEAARVAKPLDNTDFSLGWRKRVAKAYVAGALRELRGDDPRTLGLLARRATALRPLA